MCIRDRPYAQMPNQFSYVSYRDDFPSDIAGLSRQASEDLAGRGDCQDEACIEQEAIDNRTITWADELPSFIQGDDLVVQMCIRDSYRPYQAHSC